MLWTSGCLSHHADITSDPQFAGDLRVGDVYRLGSPVEVYDGSVVDHRGPSTLGSPGYWLVINDATATAYERLSAPSCPVPKPNAKPRAILAAGSRLRFTRIQRYDYVTMSDVHYFFEMLDGELRGKEVCGNALIKRGTLGQVDERFAMKDR
jgi:hypothetical protein